MNFETEKICLNQLIMQKKDDFCAEDNIIIPDIKPDILSTIDYTGNIYIYKKEIINGRLKIDGGVQTYIIYLADNEENNIRGLHTIIDFSHSIEIDNLTQKMDLECDLKIKNIECKILNGRKVNIKVNIETNIGISSNEEKEFVKTINDAEEIQMISNTIEINCLKGRGETIATAKDTISVDDNLADIISSEINIRNKDIKISYNKVLSKADVMVEIMYLTEEEKINTLTAQIPIMGFIDIPNISDKEACNTNYKIRNINIKPNNVEDHTINVEIEFLITCKVFENKSINLIQDLYSPQEEFIMSQENVSLMQNKSQLMDSSSIQEKMNISEVNNNKIFNIAVATNIMKENILNGSISYEGELILKILFESSITNKIEAKEQRLTFTHSISSENITKNSIVNTQLEIDSKDFIFMPDNTIDIKVNVNFIVDLYQKSNVNIVKDISIEENSKNNNLNSLVIYFVKENDTLWKIAKKFKSTIDEIAKVNNIEDVDKINIGDQLYIPKYVYNRIS